MSVHLPKLDCFFLPVFVLLYILVYKSHILIVRVRSRIPNPRKDVLRDLIIFS